MLPGLPLRFVDDAHWHMTFDPMNMRRFLHYMKNALIYQVWFQLDFKFSKVNFTFLAILTTWPLMTFNLGIWPLTTWTYKGSHIVSINQDWFHSDFQLFKWCHSHFQPILQLDLRWPFILICDIWPHQQMRVPMLHLWPNFGWNPSKHVEGRAKC